MILKIARKFLNKKQNLEKYGQTMWELGWMLGWYILLKKIELHGQLLIKYVMLLWGVSIASDP